tara:strand:+ start:114 stop:332 length:219 start_codon:yes stop_codon:yes gene_type:complete
MIGWIGLGLLMLAYLALAITKWSKFFIPIDTIASFLLTLHAYTINDKVFLIVNGWITIILAVKWYKNQLEVN